MHPPFDSYLAFDRAAFTPPVQWLIGVDEAGRGPLAGPVFAAAVAVHREFHASLDERSPWTAVRDSKRLPAGCRAELHGRLMESSRMGHGLRVGVGMADVEEIERLNILVATRLAMYRALVEVQARLPDTGMGLPRTDASLFELDVATSQAPVEVWVDGRPLKDFPFEHRAWVKGDGRSWCIALASIVAKVRRDGWMMGCHQQFPCYAWDQNKGYGTQAHQAALLKHGLSPFHRRSFLKRMLP